MSNKSFIKRKRLFPLIIYFTNKSIINYFFFVLLFWLLDEIKWMLYLWTYFRRLLASIILKSILIIHRFIDYILYINLIEIYLKRRLRFEPIFWWRHWRRDDLIIIWLEEKTSIFNNQRLRWIQETHKTQEFYD